MKMLFVFQSNNNINNNNDDDDDNNIGLSKGCKGLSSLRWLMGRAPDT